MTKPPEDPHPINESAKCVTHGCPCCERLARLLAIRKAAHKRQNEKRKMERALTREGVTRAE